MDIFATDFDFTSVFCSALDDTENMWSSFYVGKPATLTIPNRNKNTKRVDDGLSDDSAQLFTELNNAHFHDAFLTEASQDDSSNSSFTLVSQPQHCADNQDSDIADDSQAILETSCQKSSKQNSKSKDSESKSSSRNAILARRCREKRKQYVAELEASKETLVNENEMLKEKQENMHNTIKDLQHEVKYLHSLLTNGSELASILQAISNVPGMKLSNNILQPSNRKRLSSDVDHAYSKTSSQSKRTKLPKTTFSSSEAGICVHVSSGSVSLGLCHKCNENHAKDFSCAS